MTLNYCVVDAFLRFLLKWVWISLIQRKPTFSIISNFKLVKSAPAQFIVILFTKERMRKTNADLQKDELFFYIKLKIFFFSFHESDCEMMIPSNYDMFSFFFHFIFGMWLNLLSKTIFFLQYVCMCVYRYAQNLIWLHLRVYDNNK